MGVEEIVSDDCIKEVKEQSDSEEDIPNRRRSSGRIAKNMVLLQEKKKKEEEEEKAEKEAKLKKKMEEKIRKKAENEAKKKAKALKRNVKNNNSSESEHSDSSDCQVEEVVVKSKSNVKLASIFTGGRKEIVVKPTEDPLVTAARRAFLMSSAPESLKSQLSEEK